jgi:hypothetical protein
MLLRRGASGPGPDDQAGVASPSLLDRMILTALPELENGDVLVHVAMLTVC